MKLTQYNIKIALILALIFGAGSLSACPLINGFVDFNCDGQIRLAFTGDSIVTGVGDQKELGGYPGRLENKLNFIVKNIGVPGASVAQLLRQFKRNIDKDKITTKKTRDLDYLFIEIGTNDYWDYRNRGRSIGLTPRNIRRLKKYLENKLEEKWGVKPLIVTSTLPPVRRDYQQPFIDNVNKMIRKLRKKLNTLVFFDKLPSSIIGEDELHPNSKGYKKMARIVERVFTGLAQKQALKQRTDEDLDGLYDEVEAVMYGTDPLLADSDSDNLLDGEEVFTYQTDPTLVDTDGDGELDDLEIENGTDPLDPLDPTPTPTPTPVPEVTEEAL